MMQDSKTNTQPNANVEDHGVENANDEKSEWVSIKQPQRKFGTRTAEKGDSSPVNKPERSEFRRSQTEQERGVQAYGPGKKHPLQYTYSFWFFRKTADFRLDSYEKSIKKIGDFSTVEDFWGYYCHLTRPDEMPISSDYHLFKEGIKPMWEDEANKEGGKWIVRLKKGYSTRYWEDLILAVVGEQFDVGDEICGCVLSIREHDIISVWNKSASNKEAIEKIRDNLRRLLRLPPRTVMEYKSHVDAIRDQSSFRNTIEYKHGEMRKGAPNVRGGTATRGRGRGGRISGIMSPTTEGEMDFEQEIDADVTVSGEQEQALNDDGEPAASQEVQDDDSEDLSLTIPEKDEQSAASAKANVNSQTTPTRAWKGWGNTQQQQQQQQQQKVDQSPKQTPPKNAWGVSSPVTTSPVTTTASPKQSPQQQTNAATANTQTATATTPTSITSPNTARKNAWGQPLQTSLQQGSGSSSPKPQPQQPQPKAAGRGNKK